MANESPGQDEQGRVTGVGYTRLFNWGMKRSVAKKPLSGNILRRFGIAAPGNACMGESGFVNHVRIVSNRFVPPRFFTLAAFAALTLSPAAAR
jgi:hypothetical protein